MDSELIETFSFRGPEKILDKHKKQESRGMRHGKQSTMLTNLHLLPPLQPVELCSFQLFLLILYILQPKRVQN